MYAFRDIGRERILWHITGITGSAPKSSMRTEAFCEQKNIFLTSSVFYDKQTGKNFNRPEYQFIRNRIQPGDTLIITEMDRLGRNRAEILKELQFFKDRRGVRYHIGNPHNYKSGLFSHGEWHGQYDDGGYQQYAHRYVCRLCSSGD